MSSDASGKSPTKTEQRAELIVKVLADHPGEWIAARQILTETELTRPQLKEPIKRLLAEERIVRTGERSGTRYRRADDDAPEPDESGPAPSRRLAPASSTAKAETKRRATARDTGAHKETQQVYDAIAATGAEGIRSAELAQKLGISKGAVKARINGLTQKGKLIRIEIDEEPSLYRTADVGLAPKDGDGARTRLERDVVAAVRALGWATSDGPDGIFGWIKLNREDSPMPRISAVRIAADGLVRRGVLYKSDGRYGLEQPQEESLAA